MAHRLCAICSEYDKPPRKVASTFGAAFLFTHTQMVTSRDSVSDILTRMELFELFVTFIGVLMSLGYYPQAYKIWKNKSSANISIPTFTIFSVGTLTWFIYGILISDMPIVFSFGLGVVGSWLVLILSIIFRIKR